QDQEQVQLLFHGPGPEGRLHPHEVERRREVRRGRRIRRLKKARALKVVVSEAGPLRVPQPRALSALARKVLAGEGVAGEVNLVFCEDAHVRALNRRYRKLDKVTDVLSFIYGEDEEVFGEIYIATAQAQRQAPRWKNTFSGELRRLVVHGA